MDPQKNDLTEQEELKILGEILEAYIDTPIEKDAFLIGDLGLDSFLIVYFISEVDDRFGVTIEMPEHVEYMTVQDVLDQLNQKNLLPENCGQHQTLEQLPKKILAGVYEKHKWQLILDMRGKQAGNIQEHIYGKNT